MKRITQTGWLKQQTFIVSMFLEDGSSRWRFDFSQGLFPLHAGGLLNPSSRGLFSVCAFFVSLCIKPLLALSGQQLDWTGTSHKKSHFDAHLF